MIISNLSKKLKFVQSLISVIVKLQNTWTSIINQNRPPKILYPHNYIVNKGCLNMLFVCLPRAPCTVINTTQKLWSLVQPTSTILMSISIQVHIQYVSHEPPLAASKAYLNPSTASNSVLVDKRERESETSISIHQTIDLIFTSDFWFGLNGYSVRLCCICTPLEHPKIVSGFE